MCVFLTYHPLHQVNTGLQWEEPGLFLELSSSEECVVTPECVVTGQIVVTDNVSYHGECSSSLLLIEPCVCVCAKFDQFLPLRSHFVSKPPENFVRIAKFPYAAFGPLFAFHCPLFFTRNDDLE